MKGITGWGEGQLMILSHTNQQPLSDVGSFHLLITYSVPGIKLETGWLPDTTLPDNVELCPLGTCTVVALHGRMI